MSTNEDDFEQMMQRVRAGCPEAIRELVERYYTEIQIVVRHRLSERLRAQFDSLDFTQDAWASFFHIPAENYTFKTPEELVAFLSRLAHHKVLNAYKQQARTKRNRHAVEELRRRSADDAGNEPAARQPTPSQLAIAEEQWDRLLAEQPPQIRRALKLLRAGHSHQEVAACLGVHPKMIQRLLQNLNQKLNLS